MTGFAEIVVVAFVAQLAVLPGEKVQFIIAGLATRYSPWLVVAAASTAFAGWTAVEVAFGEALRGALPGVALDAITAGLFALFAYLLYRSAPADGESVAPQTDGGEASAASRSSSGQRSDGGEAATAAGDLDVSLLGHRVPSVAGGFLPIFVLMAAGEFGDKTQLVTIGLAVQYGATPAIWVGEMLAIVPVSLANAFFFHRFAGRVDMRRAHLAGAALFAFFAADTVMALLTGFSVWETVVAAVSDAVLGLA